MFCCFLFLLIPVIKSDSFHRTLYTCEGSTLHLSCPLLSTIAILRTNYGRFSISVCNDVGSDTMMTDCGDLAKTTKMISNMCEDKSECEVKVDEFEDTENIIPLPRPDRISKYISAIVCGKHSQKHCSNARI